MSGTRPYRLRFNYRSGWSKYSQTFSSAETAQRAADSSREWVYPKPTGYRIENREDNDAVVHEES